MARKLRLEFPGATYHIINRGNYRSWIFKDESTKAAFESCLFESCESSRWLVHAFVIMGNHFHLAIETPEGNLIAGMQWLQATFANRFNRFRDVRGHLFQGRYKSLLVEPGAALGQVCHYIHLNPARAGLSTPEQLSAYRYSSYWYLHQARRRRPFMRVTTALTEAGGLADSRAGRQAYGRYLAWQAAEGSAGKNQAYLSLSRGWAVGTREFKRTLIAEHNLVAASRAWETSGAQEVRETQWQRALEGSMQALKKSQADIARDRKGAPWKIAVAAHLKRTTQADDRWLNQRLVMGSPAAVAQYVSRLRRSGGPSREILQQIQELTT